MGSERMKRLFHVCAVIGIALGAGHIAQEGQHNVTFAAMVPQMKPVDVVPLSATAETRLVLADLSPAEMGLPVLPLMADRPDVSGPARLDMPQPVADLDCTPVLRLAPAAGAMIDVGLSSPCRPSERIVLRHAGLAVTYRTNSVGALTARLPALTDQAVVSVLFAGGNTIEAELTLPEAGQMRRFGVQWLGPLAFGINAFENGADYGGAGHVSAADAGRPVAGSQDRGFLTLLGDDTVDQPMLAEVYTYPDGSRDVPVVVEAAITEKTCGQDLLGETLNVVGGAVALSDLSVTMPGCDAAGDFLLLKNLVPDMTLASAN
jgi:hypothetical protein